MQLSGTFLVDATGPTHLKVEDLELQPDVSYQLRTSPGGLILL